MNEKKDTYHDCHGLKWKNINFYSILICRRHVVFGCLFVEWKIIEREKGEDHERVEKKAIGQLVVKKKKGSRTVMGKRGR